MKRTYYAALYPGYTDLCRQLVWLACANNGGNKEQTIQDLANIVKAECTLYPSLNADINPEIIGDDTLHIDRKIGDKWETVCIIEMRETFELPEPFTEYNGYGALAE